MKWIKKHWAGKSLRNDSYFFFLFKWSMQDFSGSAGEYTPVYHKLNPPIRARYIRFLPVVWHNNIAMKVELYGCQGTVALFLFSFLLLLLFRNSATAICHKRLIYYSQRHNDKLYFDKHVYKFWIVLFHFILTLFSSFNRIFFSQLLLFCNKFISHIANTSI